MHQFVGRADDLVNFKYSYFSHVNITNNEALEGDGGGIFIRSVIGTLQFKNTYFEGNTAMEGVGGAIGISSPGDVSNYINFDGLVVKGCKAHRGGGLGGDGMLQIRLANSTFEGNVAERGGGGAIYCTNCLRLYVGFPGRVKK